MRISDLDRDLAAQRLRDAASAGVLGIAELEWRLDRVLAAVTRGQLEAVLLDLPAPRSVRASPASGWLRAHIGGFVIVNSGLAAIWAAAGFGYFWPVWPLIGWGMLISGHACAARLLQRPTKLDALATYSRTSSWPLHCPEQPERWPSG